MTIIEGWRLAVGAAHSALIASAQNNAENAEKFREDLMDIARTTLSSKILNQAKEFFAKLCVDAVMRLKGSTNLDAIHVIKKTGGSLQDSFLEDGFILEKKIGVGQPKRLENPKILIANTPMDTDKIKIFGAKIKTDSTKQVAEIEEVEREKMLTKCAKIVNHGINCFINRQLIYNLPEQYFAEKGVMAIEHADFEGIERLALVLGAEITSTFDHPELVKIGTCKLIEEVMIGEDKVIRFSGVPVGEACTIVLRGATSHMLDEAERSIHDALCVLSQTIKESRVVYGGGCSEVLMANAVDELAKNTKGKQAIAMEAYARAMRMLPTIIADNGGYDSSELVSQLRAEHYRGNKTMGLDMVNGIIGDMAKLRVVDSFKVKQQVLLSGTEAAEMILRVDDIVKSAPRQREDPHGGH
jgi:T-complex protein 1 subunit beta